jgi:hypothetical protein
MTPRNAPPVAAQGLLSSLFDAGASDSRLDQLARMTAAKFWRAVGSDDDLGRSWVFVFAARARYVYIVLPIFRRRYWAVVRIEGVLWTLARESGERLTAEDFETKSISVFKPDALKLACQAVEDEP